MLAQQTGLDPNLNGADIKQAFEKSDLFLEASLAAGAVPSSGSAPDLKAALLVLRQTLQTVLGGQSAGLAPLLRGEAAPALAPSAAQELDAQEILLPQARVPVAEDIGEIIIPVRAGFAGVLKDAPPAATLNLLQETAPELAHAATAATPFRTAQGEEVHTNTPAPPFRGALPSAQPVASASVSPETPLAPAAHLLADTDAAIARHTLLQVASLPDRIDALPQPAQHNDPAAPRWNFEIPFATPQGTAMAQFEISRDGGGPDVEAAKKVWRARFTLDVEPTGPVHALVSLVGEKTSVRMWAERPATAEKLRAGSAELSRALARAELKPGDIVVRDGTPPQPQSRVGRPLPGSRAVSTDPKQLAVALHYDRTGAPRVVAKGKGAIGAKIVEIAKAHDIPIEENEVLAGALSKVELGDEIPAELYKAVAEVLIFVLRLSGRVR